MSKFSEQFQPVTLNQKEVPHLLRGRRSKGQNRKARVASKDIEHVFHHHVHAALIREVVQVSQTIPANRLIIELSLGMLRMPTYPCLHSWLWCTSVQNGLHHPASSAGEKKESHSQVVTVSFFSSCFVVLWGRIYCSVSRCIFTAVLRKLKAILVNSHPTVICLCFAVKILSFYLFFSLITLTTVIIITNNCYLLSYCLCTNT